jgi:hypothetical protein
VKQQSVRIMVEGADAEAATRNLFSMGWFEAEWEQRRDARTSSPASIVNAQVLAIAGGSVTIADNMLSWWQTWRASSAGSDGLAVVLEGPTGNRVSLESADRDALVDVLRVLHAPGR